MTRNILLITSIVCLAAINIRFGNAQIDENCLAGDGSESCENYHDDKILSEEKEKCQDLHENCQLWAYDGECMMNPRYMLAACKSSCFLCVSDFDRQNLDGEALRIKEVYSKMDVGKEQFIPREPGKLREGVKRVVIKMDNYAKTKVTDRSMNGVRRLCTNQDTNCSLWAYEGKCASDPTMMMEQCPLACRTCAMLDEFRRCRELKEKDQPNIFLLQDSIPNLFRTLEESHPEAELLSSGNDSASKPWVVSINNFLSIQVCDELLELSNKSLEWKLVKSNPEQEQYHQHEYRAAKFNETTSQHPSYAKAITEILESFSSSSLEPKHPTMMEVLSFGETQSRAPKHHYRASDVWKLAGPRILSVVICLKESAVGGSFGFPDLDWTFLKMKKGQALVWSNVAAQASEPTGEITFHKLESMVHEVLPVIEGEQRFALLFIHGGDWQSAYKVECT